jgi:subtilisin family serine protease
MSRNVGILFVLVSILVSGSMLAQLSYAGESGGAAERKIVVFADGVSDGEKDALLGNAHGVKIKHLSNGKDSVALLDGKSTGELLQSGKVIRVEDDVIVSVLGKPDATAKGKPSAPTQPNEVLPWGIDRVDAELLWGASTTGSGINIAVIDTGIELNHPDLALNIKGGYNAISPLRSPNDDNGHGTHVAGIIGALDNTIGVIGAAPTVNLYAVKVLSRTGSGYISDIIEGLDWARMNGMHVVNMSLGASSDVQSFHDAVIRAHNAGVVLVAAAGNDSGGAVSYPGAYPEVIAVSATDNTNTIAYFSSVGPEVDLAAPGAGIFSSYKGQTYATLSGTSMASPHVAGVVALLLTQSAKCDTDLSGTCSPLEVQERLESTATDLGTAGKDNQYGSGLVNAWAALQ